MDRILREMTQSNGGDMQQGGAAQGQGQAKGTSATSPLCDAQVLLQCLSTPEWICDVNKCLEKCLRTIYLMA